MTVIEPGAAPAPHPPHDDLVLDPSMWRVVRGPDRIALAAIGAAAVLTDLAVRSGVDGLGGWLLVVAVVAGLFASGRVPNRRAWPVLAVVPLLALGLVTRAAEWVVALDVVAAAGVLLVGATFAGRGDPFDLSLPHLIGRGLHGAAHQAAAPGFVLRGIGRAPGSSGGGSSIAVVRGLLLAAPVLGVISLLLGSADPVFASFFRLPTDLGDVAIHVVLLVVGAWGAAGLLRIASAEPYGLPLAGRRWLGRVEARTVLGGLVVVFAAFTTSQLLTALGGAEYVRRTSGLSYSEHARSGFFQLLAVAAITLATLLLLRAAVREQDRTFTLASITAVVLTLLLVAGALRRLGLYEQAYGLTLLRLFAVLFALWIGAVFVLLGFSLAGAAPNRAWFVPSAVGLALAGVLVLNVGNPEAWIVRRNTERFAASGRFDAAALADLSDDAVPALVEALDDLPPEEAEALRVRVCAGARDRTGGLFAFNVAEAAAADARARACAGRPSA